MTQTSDRYTPVPSDVALHAYIDGRLPAAERTAVESYLAANPEILEVVNAWQSQNLAMHALDRRTPLAPPSAALSHAIDRLEARAHRPRSRLFDMRLTAAVVLVLAAGAVVAGIAGSGPVSAPPPVAGIGQDAAMLYRAFASPGSIRGFEAGVAGAPGAPIARIASSPPDLSVLGLSAALNRVVTMHSGEAAQIVYTGHGGGHVSLFVGPLAGDREDRFTMIGEHDISLIYWQQGGVSLALLGRVDKVALLDAARAVAAEIAAAQPAAPSDGPAGTAPEILHVDAKDMAEPDAKSRPDTAPEPDEDGADVPTAAPPDASSPDTGLPRET